MSLHVNFLPYREERRKLRQRQFRMQLGLVAALAFATLLLAHGVISGYVSVQQERNQFLKEELARLDKEIGEIARLRQEVAALLARKQVIERLQTDRAQAVQVPEGVYLRQIKQTGLRVNLQGYSQANARVSTLMRNLADSPYMENPELVEIKSVIVSSRRVSEFNMNVSLRNSPVAEPKPGTAATRASAAPEPAKGAQ